MSQRGGCRDWKVESFTRLVYHNCWFPRYQPRSGAPQDMQSQDWFQSLPPCPQAYLNNVANPPLVALNEQDHAPGDVQDQKLNDSVSLEQTLSGKRMCR